MHKIYSYSTDYSQCGIKHKHTHMHIHKVSMILNQHLCACVPSYIKLALVGDYLIAVGDAEQEEVGHQKVEG